MPMYEYQCQSCGRTLEKRQKFSDEPLTVCPHCGGRLEKLISAPAVQFKGGGWYADLYSSSKGGTKSSASAEGTSSAAASGGGSSDSSSSSAASASNASSSSASSAPPASTAPAK